MAVWYKNTGKWGDSTNLTPNDGIPLEEVNDSSFLYNYYKKLVSIKQSNPALEKGTYSSVINDNDKIFRFYRNIKTEMY